MVAIRDEALSYAAKQTFVVLVAETWVSDRWCCSATCGSPCWPSPLAWCWSPPSRSMPSISACGHCAIWHRLCACAASVTCAPSGDRCRPEGQPLVDEINALFARLEKALNSHRRFVSNTAHQLRTPLAELKTQLEVARLEGTLPDLSGLSSRVDGLAHLVEQMVLLSRIGEQPSGVDTFGDVDLRALAEQAVAEWSLRAIEAGIDLGLQVETEALARVHGHQSLLLEALGNLIDNVIKHASGATTATIQVHEDRLIVTDDGPGFRPKGSKRVQPAALRPQHRP